MVASAPPDEAAQVGAGTASSLGFDSGGMIVGADDKALQDLDRRP